MKIKLAMLGKSADDVVINKEIVTVEDVLNEKKITLRSDKKGSDQVLLNGEEVKNLKTRVADGAVITVVPKVKGGVH